MFKVLRNLIMNRPILAIFDVTKRCNQRCSICNIWRVESEEMGLDEIGERATAMSKFGIKYVFLQGGEPTLREDLLEIIDIFTGRRIKSTVISNGILVDDALAQRLAVRKCNLAISIDTLDREAYIKIRGVDTLDRVLANVREISEIKEQRGNWSITSTITRLSCLEDIKELEEFAQAHGFMYAVRPYVVVRGVAGRRDEELICGQEAIPIFAYMLKQARRTNFLAGLLYEEYIRYLRGERMDECDAIRRSVLLQETGVFSPCIEFPDLRFDLDGLRAAKEEHAEKLKACNEKTPCFYNDAREIGVLWRKKWRILANSPQIFSQLSKYGNFF